MSAFHTKTIQSILEPVALQVSTMVILDEEANQGALIPDLSGPVTAVTAAIQNLVQIGEQTIASSDDEKFQADMPRAFEVTETASKQLAEAADTLKDNPRSGPGRKLLITGARGILEGVSDLLLTFDESEVRRIIAVCNSVLEYLDAAEVVEQTDDLVTFIKNLTPGLTGMSKLIEQRQKELTNPVHAAKLVEHSEYVKKSVPMLISSIKIFCSLKSGSHPTEDAVSSRKWVVSQMSDALHELIRILQLTTNRDDLAMGDFQQMLTRMTGKGGEKVDVEQYLSSSNFEQARAFLGRMNPAEAAAGMSAIEKSLADARALANHLEGAERDEILHQVSTLEDLMAQLVKLKAEGKLDTAEGRALGKKMAAELEALEKMMRRAVTRQVVRDFADPSGPAKQLAAAALADKSVANREEVFRARATHFREHADNASRTALQVAQAGSLADEQTNMAIMATAKKVQELVPQMEGASRIVLAHPGNEAAVEHMEMIKKEYIGEMEHLKELVDEATDSVEFLKVSEGDILKDIEAAKAAARKGDAQKAMALSGMVAKRAKRVLDVARAEAENSEDPQYVKRVTEASAQLAQSVAPMAAACKRFAANPTDTAMREQFEQSADKVGEAVSTIRSVVEEYHTPPRPPTPPPVEETKEPEPVVEEAFCEVIPLPEESSGPAMPIVEAARDLHGVATMWSSEGNSLIAVARKMAQQMAEMGRLFDAAGDPQSRKELINLAKAIAASTADVIRLAKATAAACTDRRLKQTLLQLVDRLPTISTQLKIISTVKATQTGRRDARADREASETLVLNAQNLMKSTKEVVQAAQAATLKLKPGSAAELMWRRRD